MGSMVWFVLCNTTVTVLVVFSVFLPASYPILSLLDLRESEQHWATAISRQMHYGASDCIKRDIFGWEEVGLTQTLHCFSRLIFPRILWHWNNESSGFIHAYICIYIYIYQTLSLPSLPKPWSMLCKYLLYRTYCALTGKGIAPSSFHG